MNHFSELLNQCQGKESTDIPNDVFEKIINELNVLKITDLSKLDNKIMRTILKNLNLNSYYEHIPYIINKLNGIPPPTMTRELEEKVRSMFKEVQEPWINFKGSERKNFLNNNFVAVGGGMDTNSLALIMFSSDGDTWTKKTNDLVNTQ